jgi:hypothetical protein
MNQKEVVKEIPISISQPSTYNLTSNKESCNNINNL